MSPTITYETWNEDTWKKLLNTLKDDISVLKWAYKEYGEQIVYACSFGAEGIVLIDLINKVNPKAKVIFLDTGLHFPETYQLIERVKIRYPNMQIVNMKPVISLDEQSKWYGDELWKENPNLCCHLRKVVPLKEALQGKLAWISGLRREQSLTRRHLEYINIDEKFQKVKVCPLIHWTWEDIISYIQLNHLPYNPLHEKGYPSIGCYPCTRAISEGEDFRAGRWTGYNKTECGLHTREGGLQKN